MRFNAMCSSVLIYSAVLGTFYSELLLNSTKYFENVIVAYLVTVFSLSV